MTTPYPDKKALRATALAARKAIDAETARAASHALVPYVLEMAPKKPSVISGYRSIRNEIDITAALEGLERLGHTICLPVVEENQKTLRFYRWHTSEDLYQGKYDIAVPHKNADIVIPDIVIVPLVAFDEVGHRLGYGAGHYDATIQALRRDKKSVIIGAGYAMQQVEVIPAESHDQRLDAVVTEKGIILVVRE